jgi:hypothetical protein
METAHTETIFKDIVPVSDGLLAIGYEYINPYASEGAVIAKYDKEGNKIFKKYFDAKSNASDKIGLVFNMAVEVSDGYIVNANQVSGNETIAILKFSAEGNLIWTKEPGFNNMIGNDSGFLVLGGEDNEKAYSYKNVFMAQFNTNGDVIEKKTIEHKFTAQGKNYAIFRAKTFVGSDGYFVLAETAYTDESLTYAAHAYSPASPKVIIAFYGTDWALQWQREIAWINNIDNVFLSKDGIITIQQETSWSEGTGVIISKIIKADFEMNEIWNVSLNKYADTYGSSINHFFVKAVGIGEKVFVIGYKASSMSKSMASFYRSIILGIDQTGEVFWEPEFQGEGYYENIIATDTGFAVYAYDYGGGLHDRVNNSLLIYNTTSLTNITKTM